MFVFGENAGYSPREQKTRDQVGEVVETPSRGPGSPGRSILWGVVDSVLLIAIFGMVVTVILQVLSRALGDSFGWTGELTTILFLWTIFLGMASGFRTAEHVRITLLVQRLPRVMRRAAVHLYVLVGVLFFATIAYYGAMLFIGQYESNQRTPILDVGAYWLTAPIVVAAVLAVIAHIQSVYFSPTIREGLEYGRAVVTE